nr:hypothetical protein BaRGS_025776 [Batillaria attramentaria]
MEVKATKPRFPAKSVENGVAVFLLPSTGSLLAGLVYDLLSKSLSLILGLVALAALTAATPFCRQFTTMVAVIVLGAIFEGGVDTAGNADVIRTWGSEGGMAMQAIHFSFALGGVVAPLVTEPFLAPRLETGGPNTSTDFATALSSTSQDRPSVSTTSPGLLPLTKDVVQMYGSNSSEFLYPNSSQNDPTPPSHIRRGTGSVTKHFNHTLTTDVPFSLFTNLTDRDEGHIQQTFMDVDVRPVNLVPEAKNNATFNVSATKLTSSPLETQVHYAFIICALFTLFPAVPLLVGYASNKHQKKTDKTAKEKQKTDERKDHDAKLEDDSSSEDGLPRALFVVVLVWVCVFFMLYSAIEDTIANYLATFVVMQLDWSKSDGALLTSTFWGCFAASRFVCILVSRMVTTVQLLTTCCILMLLFFVGFLVASLLSLHWAVWTFTALIGASMSAIFPGAFSWMEVELMAVTGRITSVIMLAASLGLMISPLHQNPNYTT